MRVCLIYTYDVDLVALWMDGATLLYKRYSMMVDTQDGEPCFDLQYEDEGGVIPVDSPAPDNYSAWVDWAVDQFRRFYKLGFEDYTLVDHYWR